MCVIYRCAANAATSPSAHRPQTIAGFLVAGLPSAGASFSQSRRSIGFGLWAHRGEVLLCPRRAGMDRDMQVE